MTVLASIPSPSQGVWEIGPFPLRGYALAILIGIVVAVLVGDRRWRARGGEPGVVTDVALWAVPFGIVGGRIYHVLTSWSDYFGEGARPIEALYVWQGGLGIWGAVVLGGVGAWIGCRRRGIPLPMFGDAIAPGIALAQACGRWGNWFNQELFGGPTDLPWALEIDPQHRPAGYADVETFHPTFLYESLWCVLVALVVIWADRRFRMGHGRAFALYVAGYTLGRLYFEHLRIDPAPELGGLRWNEWVSIVVFIGAVVYIVVSARLRPGREDPSLAAPHTGAPDGEQLDAAEGDAGAARTAPSEEHPEADAPRVAERDARPTDQD